MQIWRLTDQQLIDRIRWYLRTRRRWGIVVFLMGALLAGVSLGLVQHTNRTMERIMNQLMNGPVPPDAQLKAIAGIARFRNGFVLGLIVGQGILYGVPIACTGLAMLFTRDRVNELLVRLWDEQSATPSD